MHAATAIGATLWASYDAAGNMTCRAATVQTTCAGSSPTGAVLQWGPDGELEGWQNAPSNASATQSSLYDAAGNLAVASVLYTPYGTVRYSFGTMPTDYGFTGQRQDAVSGLDDYGARYYDPIAGQFASADTMLQGGGYDPLGLSRYAYVEGNPVDLTDPTGNLIAGASEAFGGCGGNCAIWHPAPAPSGRGQEWTPPRALPHQTWVLHGWQPRPAPRPSNHYLPPPPARVPSQHPAPTAARRHPAQSTDVLGKVLRFVYDNSGMRSGGGERHSELSRRRSPEEAIGSQPLLVIRGNRRATGCIPLVDGGWRTR